MTTGKDPSAPDIPEFPIGWQIFALVSGLVLLIAAFFVSGYLAIGFFVYGMVFFLATPSYYFMKNPEWIFKQLEKGLGRISPDYDTSGGVVDSRRPERRTAPPISTAHHSRVYRKPGDAGLPGCHCGLSHPQSGPLAAGTQRRELNGGAGGGRTSTDGGPRAIEGG